jgi:phosphoribosylformimino-5-aminoimidazole carboxamide ribotide isomerase
LGAAGRRALVIVAPAVDVKGGRCVQLVGGRPEDERVSLPDPVAVAGSWWTAGFAVLHLVDLDAALGSGDNLELLAELVAATPAVTQVGGGIRDDPRARALLDAGADRIVVGTRALDDAGWLDRLCSRYPHQVMVAADTRDGTVLRKGWTESSGLTLEELLGRLAGLPLAGVLVTDVGREGRLRGIDTRSTADAVRASTHPLWISGGITTEEELHLLEEQGAAGAVLGMALYTGTLSAERVAERWGAPIEQREGP